MQLPNLSDTDPIDIDDVTLNMLTTYLASNLYANMRQGLHFGQIIINSITPE